MTFDRVLFGLYNRGGRVVSPVILTTVGQMPPFPPAMPPAPPGAPSPMPAAPAARRWPLLLAAAAVGAAVVYVARQQEHARMQELEHELENTEHHCSVERFGGCTA